eukprot:2464928-Pyramimonas_sp.AAC.1
MELVQLGGERSSDTGRPLAHCTSTPGILEKIDMHQATDKDYVNVLRAALTEAHARIQQVRKLTPGEERRAK